MRFCLLQEPIESKATNISLQRAILRGDIRLENEGIQKVIINVISS